MHRSLKWRKKPVVVEASQWLAPGDHKAVLPLEKPDPVLCERCLRAYKDHGKIRTLEDTDTGAHIVCPGDWIITGIKGENYACKPHIFVETYEPAE